MVLTPALVRGSGVVTDRILGAGETVPLATLSEPLPAARGRVLILGYGRVGQVIGRMLEETGVPYGALDSDPARVNEAALAGVPIRFGDAARAELQRGLGLESASLVVVCIDDWQGALRALTSARELNPTVPILVRSRDDRHMEAFLEAGATEVVPETFESSLMLFTHVMALLRHDRADTEAALDRVRADRYHLLHGVIAGERHSLYPEVLHPVVLPEGAPVLGHPAAQALPAALESVTVEQVRRGEALLDLEAAGNLEPGDVLLLLGPQREVEAAEAALLAG
jgi:CPA2 family monovalent cation:H+ antiporter-2